jgi:periplasmic protein TonB
VKIDDLMAVPGHDLLTRAPVSPLAITAATSGLIHAVLALAVAWTLPALPHESRQRAIDVSFQRMTPPASVQAGGPDFRPDAEQAVPPPEMAPALDVASDLPPPPAPPPPDMPPQPVEPAPEHTVATIEEALPPVEEPPPFSTRELLRAVPAPPPRQRPSPIPVVQREPAPVADSGRTNRRLAREDYLAGLIEKLSRYRFVPTAQQASAHGMVVMRVTVARDGRVLDVVLLRSSGFPALDQGLVETVRRASPFAPLPVELQPELQANQLSFTVPLAYDRQM